jgi:hypothetical protein
MGIVDVSQGALKQFQHDLQHLVGTNDTQNTENTQNTQNTLNTAESYQTANTGTNNNRNILDDTELTLTHDFDDNDDAVSIISTTNEMNQSFASGISNRSRKRKTVRQGVVTCKTYDTTLETSGDFKTALQEAKQIMSKSDSDFSQLHGTSLYDEKIDDFVKALLAGDESVLENSDMSETLNHAEALNNRRRSGDAPPNTRDVDIEKLPPPPSFMRPSTAPAAGRRVGWHDPVRRNQEYQSYWKKQPRCNPKRDHKKVTQFKWQVRNELADLVKNNDVRLRKQKDDYYVQGQASRPSTAASGNYQVPTEKKRDDIRWQIRNVLHDSVG